jgi:hypothetical protein
MFFKKHIQVKVYKLYLKGLDTELIAHHLDLRGNDVNEIIDYINEIYH